MTTINKEAIKEEFISGNYYKCINDSAAMNLKTGNYYKFIAFDTKLVFNKQGIIDLGDHLRQTYALSRFDVTTGMSEQDYLAAQEFLSCRYYKCVNSGRLSFLTVGKYYQVCEVYSNVLSIKINTENYSLLKQYFDVMDWKSCLPIEEDLTSSAINDEDKTVPTESTLKATVQITETIPRPVTVGRLYESSTGERFVSTSFNSTLVMGLIVGSSTKQPARVGTFHTWRVSDVKEIFGKVILDFS